VARHQVDILPLVLVGHLRGVTKEYVTT
jgi:hypothetical protein